MVDGWAGFSAEILQLIPLLLYHLRMALLVRTAEVKFRTFTGVGNARKTAALQNVVITMTRSESLKFRCCTSLDGGAWKNGECENTIHHGITSYGRIHT